MKLQPVAFGLAAGLLWAFAVIVLAIVAAYTAYWGGLVDGLGQLYIGYEATLGGGLIGAIWAFLDAFIGCAIFAWLYNLFVK